MNSINCIRCYRLFPVQDINKSDGLCDYCDDRFDPSCGAAPITHLMPGPAINLSDDFIEKQMRALRCIEALQELVRLKAVHDRYKELGHHSCPPEHAEEFDRLVKDYSQNKAKAWAAALGD